MSKDSNDGWYTVDEGEVEAHVRVDTTKGYEGNVEEEEEKSLE